jgi:uncharacterized protein (TIGR02646 family)
MIRLGRRALAIPTASYLDRQMGKLRQAGAAERPELSSKLWRNKSAERFAEVRETLGAMCSGIERCMYCEDSAATDIDHYEPRSLAPERSFVWDNYLAACSGCNSNFKRDVFPRSAAGAAKLINPTLDDPGEHLTLSPSTGRYEPVPGSEKASASIETFGLNRAGLVAGRRNAWVLLDVSIVGYANARRSGHDQLATRIAAAAQQQPFAGVLRGFLAVSHRDDLDLVSPAARVAVADYPEIAQWAPKAAL